MMSNKDILRKDFIKEFGEELPIIESEPSTIPSKTTLFRICNSKKETIWGMYNSKYFDDLIEVIKEFHLNFKF